MRELTNLINRYNVVTNITRQLLWIVGLALSAASARAVTCTVPPGASQATIQAAVNSCGSGNTVAFAAGTFGPIILTITIPCGVSLSGPTVPYSQTPNQTATIDGSSSFIGWGFQTTPGCGETQTIQYLAWNGQQPGGSGGGGFLEVTANTTNLTVQNNWLHGVNAPSTDGGRTGQNIQANLINFAGGPSAAVTSNVSILNNIFGSTSLSDCAGAMTEVHTEDGGGYCNGVGIGTNVANVTIKYNIFHWLEQGMKFYEGRGECNPLTVSNNDYSHIQRIMYETQCNFGGSQPTLMNIQYNSFHDRGVPGTPGQQNYDLSVANGCTLPTLNNPTNCVSHIDYNLDLQASAGQADVGIEIWGGAGTTANYNLLQGYLYNGITWSASGQFSFNNNRFNLVNNGTGTNCATGPFGGFWNRENNGETATPSCTGNAFSNAITGTTSSVAPTISPASGALSGSQVVTINNPGTNRDTNTTDWCTTDGSTPTPGSGTAVGYYNGGTLKVTGTMTVKCVGMWGALNQPTSYPVGYGYTPSSVVSAVYTGAASGVPTIVGVNLGPAYSGRPVTVGSTIQMVAYAKYSDGSTSTLPDKYGNVVNVWNTTNHLVAKISSGGHVTALAAGSVNIEAMVGDVVATPWAVGIPPGSGTGTQSAPAVVSVNLGPAYSARSVTVGSTIQMVAYAKYSDGSVSTLPDKYGNVVSMWNTTNHLVAKISSGGHVTALAAGSVNIEAMVGGIVATPWAVTVSPASAPGAQSPPTKSAAALPSVEGALSAAASGPSPAAPVGPLPDNFNGPLWNLVNPDGGSASISNAHLFVGVPGGANHDAFASSNHAVRVVQAIGNDKFDVAIELDSPLVAADGNASQGLMVLAADGDFITFALTTDGSKIGLTARTVTSGTASTVLNDSAFSEYQNPIYLRLTRTGTAYVALYSVDGADWKQAASFTDNMRTTSVGPFASNYGNNSANAVPVVMSIREFVVY